MFGLNLLRAIGPGESNLPMDVDNTREALNTLGFGIPAEDKGVWTENLNASVRTFQELNGLKIDGTLLAGGPTQSSISSALQRRADRPEIGAIESGHSNWFRAEPEQRSSITDPYSHAILSFEAPNVFRRDSYRQDDHQIDTASPNSIKTASFTEFAASPAASDYWDLRSDIPTQSEKFGSIEINQRPHVFQKSGLRYTPDPVGRIGWGYWTDASGRKNYEEQNKNINGENEREAAALDRRTPSSDRKADIGYQIVTPSNLAPVLAQSGRLVARNSRDLAHIRVVAAPFDAPISLSETKSRIARANQTLRLATIDLALSGKRISPDQVASIITGALSSDLPTSGVRHDEIRQKLLKVAGEARPDSIARQNAVAMLIVHNTSFHDAIARRHPRPELFADRSVLQFLADEADDVSWRATFPGEPDPDDEYDDPILEQVSDDGKPALRGARNPEIQMKALEGTRSHQDFTDLHRPKEDSKGWKINRSIEIPNQKGKYLRPDAHLPGVVIVDLKPDTPSGHRAGEAAKKKYSILKLPVFILYQKRGNSSGATPPASSPPTTTAPSSSPTISSSRPLKVGPSASSPSNAIRTGGAAGPMGFPHKVYGTGLRNSRTDIKR